MNEPLQELALYACKGNEHAAGFLLDIVRVLHYWDDCIDRDKEQPTDEIINEMFIVMLVRLPRNPFYVANFLPLNTTLVNAIANWQAATKMEREGGAYETSIAFITRSSYVDIVVQTAFIIGGPQWAAHIAERVHRFAHQETYAGYLNNLRKEQESRDVL